MTGEYVCEHPLYKVLVVSKSPLVIYIQNFITPSERTHLLELAENTFTRSGITSHDNNNNNTSALRTSQSTTLPLSDPVVACTESRAVPSKATTRPAPISNRSNSSGTRPPSTTTSTRTGLPIRLTPPPR
ncbi:hypothetical protein VTI74DRAFT_7546 [Chaetomium olivicolor]